jgi:hypothetical protein
MTDAIEAAKLAESYLVDEPAPISALSTNLTTEIQQLRKELTRAHVRIQG